MEPVLRSAQVSSYNAPSRTTAQNNNLVEFNIFQSAAMCDKRCPGHLNAASGGMSPEPIVRERQVRETSCRHQILAIRIISMMSTRVRIPPRGVLQRMLAIIGVCCVGAFAQDAVTVQKAASSKRVPRTLETAQWTLLDERTGERWKLAVDSSGKQYWTLAPVGRTVRDYANDGLNSTRTPAKNSGEVAHADELQMLEGRKPIRVKLNRSRMRYLMVTAKVGGKELNLILDTGAPYSCLDRKRTAHLKLEWRNVVSPESSLKPDGTPRSFAFLELIEVGTYRASTVMHEFDLAEINRNFSACGEPPADGLLGGDILESAAAIVNYRSCELVLTDDGKEHVTH